MRVAEAMSRDVCIASPNQSISEVASKAAGEAVTGVSRPGGPHSQSANS